jgi:hypothetical protein
MFEQPNFESLSREDRIDLAAIKAIKSDTSLSTKRAAAIYDVSRSTLRTQRAGTTSRRDSQPNSSKLTNYEEEAIIQCIQKLGVRGCAPTLGYVRDMANQLLAVRNGGQVGEKWASNLVRRKSQLKSRLTRQTDCQRALCSDPAIIRSRFNLVRNVKAKYGILDEDTYKFDETSFTIGAGGNIKGGTASERRNQPIAVQSSKRKWVTLIAAINAAG